MEQRILKATAEDAGARLDAWLAGQLEGVGRPAAARLRGEGRFPGGGRPAAKNTRLQGDETVCVTLPDPEAVDVVPQNIPLDIVYEDEDVIVVNKPKGLVVHPAPGHPDGTLVNALLYHCGDSLSGIGGGLRPGIVPPPHPGPPRPLLAAEKEYPPPKPSPPPPGPTPAPAPQCGAGGGLQTGSATVEPPPVRPRPPPTSFWTTRTSSLSDSSSSAAAREARLSRITPRSCCCPRLRPGITSSSFPRVPLPPSR